MKTKNLVVSFVDSQRLESAKKLFLEVQTNNPNGYEYAILTTEDLNIQETTWFSANNIFIKKYKTPVYYGGLETYPITLYVLFYLFTSEFKEYKKIIYLDSEADSSINLSSCLETEGFAALKADRKKLRDLFSYETIVNHNFSVAGRIGINKVEFDTSFIFLKNDYNLKRLAFDIKIFVFDPSVIDETTFFRLLHIYNAYGKIGSFAVCSELNLFFYDSWQELKLMYNSD